MPKQFFLIILITSLLTTHCTQQSTIQETQRVEQATGSSKAFETATVRFEQNATDGDVEVVFEVKGGDAGILSLKITAPDGRIVSDFTAPDPTTLGIRQFVMESPEPKGVQSLKNAYPEGVYSFTGIDAEGISFQSEATLNHQLPATASFLNPMAEAKEIPIEALEIKWDLLENIVSYIVEIEQDELEVNITAKLTGDATSFAVPEHFLQPGTDYALSIGTVTKEGNISFVETSFTTAGEE